MAKGELRKQILDKVPEEGEGCNQFYAVLDNWITILENRVGEIRHQLDSINSINDLHKIEDVYEELKALEDALW